jgi:hypothetical protein
MGESRETRIKEFHTHQYPTGRWFKRRELAGHILAEQIIR